MSRYTTVATTLVAALTVAVHHDACAQASSMQVDTSRRADAAVDSIVRERMRATRTAGAAVAVMLKGKLVKQTSYGIANVATGEPVTPTTGFFVASITKAFTSAMVFSLVDDGRLSLDDSLTKLLPGIPPAWSGITVRHLLSGTSGLPEVSAGFGISYPDYQTAMDSARTKPLLGRPGETYAYVGPNSWLLGKIVEARTGKTFAESVRARLFEPLGLASAAFGDWHALKPGRAEWYSTLVPPDKFTAEPYLLRTVYPEYVWPSAGMFISAGDLARYVDALAAGRVLKPESLALLWSAPALANGKRNNVSMGSGQLQNSPKLVAHEGGARSTVVHMMDTQLTIVILTNTQGGVPLWWVEDISKQYMHPI